jgi:hypothetical protein
MDYSVRHKSIIYVPEEYAKIKYCYKYITIFDNKRGVLQKGVIFAKK